MDFGMAAMLVSIFVVAGSIVALVFRRIVLKNQKRHEQPQ
jgi:hypothetical protein